MNLSPDWVPLLAGSGDEVLHWSFFGAANAPDHEILTWARQQDAVVLTQDLDFSQLLFCLAGGGAERGLATNGQ